jgi:hypothetical protein
LRVQTSPRCRVPVAATNADRHPPILNLDDATPPRVLNDRGVLHLHARMRRATRARGHFPNEQAALKCLYLVVRSLDPTGRGAERWMNRWKPALNAFAVTFEGRLFPTINDNRQRQLHRYPDSPVDPGRVHDDSMSISPSVS